MPEQTVFGRRVRSLRDARGWTQEELSDHSKVPAAMISHFETGQRQKASADNLVKLANAFDVTLDYLLGRTDEPGVASERFAAAFRGLSEASSETVDSALDVVRTLVDRDRERRRSDGPQGTRDTQDG